MLIVCSGLKQMHNVDQGQIVSGLKILEVLGRCLIRSPGCSDLCCKPGHSSCPWLKVFPGFNVALELPKDDQLPREVCLK